MYVIIISLLPTDGAPSTTVNDLERFAGVTVSDGQLDTMIPTDTIHIFAGCFDNYNNYTDILKLTDAEQTDVKRMSDQNGSQSAMRETLKIWRGHNPETATYREILKIVMKFGKQQVARVICKYIKENEPKS